MSKKAFEQLSEQNQSILKETAKKYCSELVRLTRRDNDEAREILKKSGVKFVLPSKQEVPSFEENAKKTYEINIPELYSKDLFNRVQEILTEFRETSKTAKRP